MKEIVYFNTEQPLEKKSLEKFLADKFEYAGFHWSANFYDFLMDHEVHDHTAYISVENSNSGFKYHYSVFARQSGSPTLNQQVELLKDLSKKAGISILSTDDEIDPWTWILIEPNGEISTVHTEGEELVVAGPYNFTFGAFSTKINLTDPELEILKKIIAGLYQHIEINFSTDGTSISYDFDQSKNNFSQLQEFSNYYVIRPVGKNKWLDRNTKSDVFTSFMTEFQNQVKKELCIFPRNFSEVKNIEGGSDHEEHCILLTAIGHEKFIYKPRRKSWKS
ncbi:hypothetical protein [Pedobacter caeni]|uniref:Uncharacterized protein n=1 Tax=Pedobacter caeni TaxID=288992 RepID=A0A1M4T9T8_9SPHI|nr:hypothetical protein [Pedobacter caeni]SHE41253.1 hypothetical protein SAMN04488522_101130 [Pedobacter caeni]